MNGGAPRTAKTFGAGRRGRQDITSYDIVFTWLRMDSARSNLANFLAISAGTGVQPIHPLSYTSLAVYVCNIPCLLCFGSWHDAIAASLTHSRSPVLAQLD
jgi:hypothetical protein